MQKVIQSNLHINIITNKEISMETSYQNSFLTGLSQKTIIYKKTKENFPNPERGFFIAVQPFGSNTFKPLSLSKLKKITKHKISLVRRIYLIEEFRDKPISQSFIQLLKNDFNTARQAGVKLIIRFSYNWSGGGQDTTKNRILSHLNQLKPILEDNYDVIAYMEGGFIGFWGQWNQSSNGLDRDIKAKREILQKTLSILPPERMVAIPYPRDKKAIFQNTEPLTKQEAYSGKGRSRVGIHNDCFLASIDDWAAYESADLNEIDKEKIFLNLDNLYVVQGGEVCDTSAYDDCPNALNELERMRWSALNWNPDDAAEILQEWGHQGCLEEVKIRLGYRFSLLKSVITSRTKPGGSFLINFKVVNNGWASPYNSRKIEIVLRNQRTGDEYYLPLKEDPRKWMPNSTNFVTANIGIPSTMPLGKYQVLLNLPDPAPKLYNRPEYSIRLANNDVWEKSTGYNSLLANVMIDKEVKGEKYNGDIFFRKRRKTI